MTNHHQTSSAIAETIAVGRAWRAYDNVLEPGAAGRRVVRAALLEARRAGAAWGKLAEEVGIEPSRLRDFAGCMPRYGRDRQEGSQLGQGSGRGPRHICGDGQPCRDGCIETHAEGGCGHHRRRMRHRGGAAPRLP